ncbi:MAG: DUF99 family protein [Nanoarchaeota archaeon]|nr:DUF99 family protein [Nanoarchaeota archaeon]
MVLKVVKPEIRIIGIDDSPFNKSSKKKVLVVGAIFRGGKWLEGVLSTKVNVNGRDATDKIANMINNSKHKGQLQVIMLNGIAVAGFNVIDIELLSKKTGLPVIVIMRKKPKPNEILDALSRFRDSKYRINCVMKAGEVYSCKVNGKNIYFQVYGITKAVAEKIIKLSSTHSLVPEPIRVAHMIGSGVVLGETRGRV